MNTIPLTVALRSISSDQLASKLDELNSKSHAVLVEFLLHLGELERRKLHCELGYDSVFTYLTTHLRFSNGSAYRRMTGARLLHRFPLIGEFLSSGTLNLERICRLKEVLTEENHA